MHIIDHFFFNQTFPLSIYITYVKNTAPINTSPFNCPFWYITFYLKQYNILYRIDFKDSKFTTTYTFNYSTTHFHSKHIFLHSTLITTIKRYLKFPCYLPLTVFQTNFPTTLISNFNETIKKAQSRWTCSPKTNNTRTRHTLPRF